ncbi:UNKNOWN [Stylonychia lemnae]|uniref:Uncharacterized protein n=1 Tax=Stylonychia lemnae TaxID=5949 RepID=A0A078ASY0_STYLE|nr:UNKNOWN [Stylonychia lemnae]|eukprot:CDW84317.1 UNKNOWN [Stylonychia lemnae]
MSFKSNINRFSDINTQNLYKKKLKRVKPHLLNTRTTSYTTGLQTVNQSKQASRCTLVSPVNAIDVTSVLQNTNRNEILRPLEFQPPMKERMVDKLSRLSANYPQSDWKQHDRRHSDMRQKLNQMCQLKHQKQFAKKVLIDKQQLFQNIASSNYSNISNKNQMSFQSYNNYSNNDVYSGRGFPQVQNSTQIPVFITPKNSLLNRSALQHSMNNTKPDNSRQQQISSNMSTVQYITVEEQMNKDIEADLSHTRRSMQLQKFNTTKKYYVRVKPQSSLNEMFRSLEDQKFLNV